MTHNRCEKCSNAVVTCSRKTSEYFNVVVSCRIGDGSEDVRYAGDKQAKREELGRNYFNVGGVRLVSEESGKLAICPFYKEQERSTVNAGLSLLDMMKRDYPGMTYFWKKYAIRDMFGS